MGEKVDHSKNCGGGPYTYVLFGMNYHKIGSLLSPQGAKPVYSQLYIYDTDNEISNRISAVSKHVKESTIDPAIVDQIKKVLDDVNPFVKQYRLASSMINSKQHTKLKLRLISNRLQDGRNYNLPCAFEVTALIVGDIDMNFSRRDVIIHELSGSPQHISELHASYLPLQYPILFPRGEDGYRDDVAHREETLSVTKKKKMLSMREYFAYRLMFRVNEISSILHAGKLFQQFIVDDYTMIESQRLLWVRTHQQELRADLYQGLTDALMSGERNGAFVGKRVILPSSFTGDVYTVEFQKRGLPHAHILLFLDKQDQLKDANSVDKVISAEIPDRQVNHTLYELVKRFMIHGPCGRLNTKSPCMKDNKSSKYYPKKFVDHTTIDDDGYPTYRRRDDGQTVEIKGISLDNRFVVPYNPILLCKFQAHINIEKCNQSSAIKYLFKYISKGNDRVVASIYDTSHDGNGDRSADEVCQYYNFRYISACEAAWRIFAFDIHHRYPAVERLSFHLPNQQYVVYSNDDDLAELVNKPRVYESMFLAWMQENVKDTFARTLTYSEFPQHYVYQRTKRVWKRREKGFSIGRITYTPPSSGELYYLRILLTKVKGPMSYEDIRTVNGIVYPTYRSACYTLGLLDDDNEYISDIKEASLWASGVSLRKMFVSMLLSSSLSRPDYVWDETSKQLSEDMLYIPRSDPMSSSVIISDSDKVVAALKEIEVLLQQNGKSLLDFPSLPYPPSSLTIDVRNHLILQELNYDRVALQGEAERLTATLNEEQRSIFNTVMSSLNASTGACFFVYGYGGTGKTFLWNALTCTLRAQADIVLTVASSGIAITLLPAGRTAHLRFAIPIQVNEDSVCNIKHNSSLGNLIKSTKLIIWDEAPMVQRFCVEVFDRSLKDIMHSDAPFGGKCVLMGGDFRQILPVIPKGTRADIVNACISSSYLWDYCTIFQLTRNMRLCSYASDEDCCRLQSFSQWLLDIGDGNLGMPHDGVAEIEIPSDILIKDYEDPISAIVSSTYPNLLKNLDDSSYFNDRAILAPTIEAANHVNEYMCSLLPGEPVDYFSCDSVCKSF
ncbi:uncharacterized protein LOC114726322 [Neltuma alba]|uniref:uncharacterized protein LOC114726322 n=1 Tax=Neltuma alba TaxID=207710 RepID=UPI0010A46D46|nr:uncharacterized protein LOC114726322 [Prosopis alba]